MIDQDVYLALQRLGINDRVAAVEQSVEDLMAGGVAPEHTFAATESVPEIRVRINHTHSVENGWRCDSTTVEWSGTGHPDWDAIDAALERAHQVGQAEAVERNAFRDDDGGGS